MLTSKLLTDSVTKTRLGAEVLTELRANLWPVDCQTCGRPFGRWETPALTVQAVAGIADASLHHRGCRPPRWLEYRSGATSEIMEFPYITWRAALFLLADDTVTFLVNPCYEFARLRSDGGRWQVTTLDQFADYGMGADLVDGVIVQPSLSAVIDEDRISVHVTHDAAIAHSWHISPLSPRIRDALDAKEWLSVGVTTSLDVRKQMSSSPLAALVAARQVRLGAATTTYTDQAQLLDESEFNEDVRAEMLALAMDTIERQPGIKVGVDLLRAAMECCYGNTTMIMRLRGRDKLVSALLVAALYAAKSRTKSRRPAHGGGVHVMMADASEVDECLEMFTPLAELAGYTVISLAAEPTVEQRRTEYLADIVIGLPEQFRAAYAFYRTDDGDWSLHETRGQLAMTVGVVVRHRAGDLIHRYPRVAVI